MTSDRVNYLNIALMMLSALAAFILPFEIFLFAYAVLGPLHYLTEISWLHDHGYFLKGKRDHFPLVFLCVVLLALSLSHWSPERKNQITTLVNYTAFAGAAVLLMTMANWKRAIAFALIVISFLLTGQSALCGIFFGVFLPTIVHVLIFTGAFVALGALRGRSRSAAASLMVFVLCAMSFFLYVPIGRSVSIQLRQAYAPFELLNLAIIRIFSLRVFNLTSINWPDAVYHSARGIAVMRFIAFAYLYHYLNWFSKTSIIKWNRISSSRAFAIFALWLISIALYASGSRIGLAFVMSLSFLHGFLELPLDHQTFVNVARELLALANGTLRGVPSLTEEIPSSPQAEVELA